MSVADTWDRISSWYDAHTPPGTFRLNAGADPAAVAAFEREIGADLPADFRESLLFHDGGAAFTWLAHYGELQPLARILGQWQMYRAWQASGEYAVPDSPDWRARQLDGSAKPVFWTPRRLYVTDNSGNHLTLDLDPPAGGQYGQVIQHDHEVGPRRVLAPSWSAFLAGVADDLEAGRLVYDEGEGCVAPPGRYS